MFEPWKSKGVDAPIFIGLGITASDPCLAGVLRVCSFVLFTIWVTPENRLAKLALRGSSVLTQDFRGPQMGCRFRLIRTRSVHVHKPAVIRPFSIKTVASRTGLSENPSITLACFR